MADPTVTRAPTARTSPTSQSSTPTKPTPAPTPAPAPRTAAPKPAAWLDTFDAQPRPSMLSRAAPSVLGAGENAAFSFHLPNLPIPKSINLPNPWHIFGKNDREKLLDSTKELRETAAQGRSIQSQLDRTPPSDPNYAKLKSQLAGVDQKLSRYGYTTATAPKPGTMFLDPQFEGAQLPGGQVKSSQFPTKAPVTQPPSAIDALFSSGRPVQTKTDDGRLLTFNTPAEYKAFLSENRKANGMPRTDGEPVAAQFVFEGGGGKGKRYGPVVAEMVNNGVVPASASGSSAGAIAAAFVAAGADPATIERLVTDPKLSKLMDVDLGDIHGGLMDGKALYDHVDQVLRELTGIKDRPVTFADLKMPLQILSTKMYDSDSHDPMTTVDSRKFVFSQETTPNTPVALAVRASASIPGVFDPVQMVDPMTGRELMLTDGGVIDNLPMGLGHNKLPVVGVSLEEQNQNHPLDGTNTAKPKPLPSGNIDVGNIFVNAYYGKKMNDDAAGGADDFRDRSRPQAGNFMIGVPTWNLDDPSQGDSTLKFGYDSKVDPILDKQSVQVTRNFLRNYLDDIGQAGHSGTNAYTDVPANLAFNRDVKIDGKTYTASYGGGDTVTFRQKGGTDSFSSSIGKQKIESMWLDDRAYGDLGAKLRQAAGRHQ
ncbi:MAG TPA: patatin-like phospholipase family protein [Myxococcales bacterium]|nr:patatin-like phospholipase family protein [Myxococcales bacterium]